MRVFPGCLMRLCPSKICLAAALAAVSLPLPAGAADRAVPTAPAETWPVTVCNERDKPVAIALAYKRPEEADSDDWFYRGWVVIAEHQCNLVAQSASRYFYHYATELNNAEVAWGGEVDLCVQYPGPYGFIVPRDAPECPQGTEIAPFSENFIAPGVDGFRLKFD